MRLRPEEVTAIRSAARQAFGDDVVVRLFGSRVHDHRRGGDIDLHFETDRAITDRDVARFEDVLFASVDEQKIDKVFTRRGDPLGAFERICYRDGQAL